MLKTSQILHKLILLSLLIFMMIIFFQGTIRVIEEYRNNTKTNLECYYLFELNHDAACTVRPKQLSPGSIMLIM